MKKYFGKTAQKTNALNQTSPKNLNLQPQKMSWNVTKNCSSIGRETAQLQR